MDGFAADFVGLGGVKLVEGKKHGIAPRLLERKLPVGEAHSPESGHRVGVVGGQKSLCHVGEQLLFHCPH
jgi:hypothetical protein